MKEKIKVFFPNQDKTILVEPNTTVASACAIAGFPLDLVCGGKGRCGQCKVDIVKNGIKNRVLACQEKITGELQVLLEENQVNKKANILTHGLWDSVDFDPAIKRIHLKKEDCKAPTGYGTWDHINDLFGQPIETYPLDVLQKSPYILHSESPEGMDAILWKNVLIDIREGDRDIYGFAVDIGTTTVVGYFYNLMNGKMIGVYSSLNGQVSEGADVISRIVACIEDPEGLGRLQGKIVDTLNKLIDQAVKQHNIDYNDIYYMALCGNSAMQHLFLGLYPEYLGKYPFTSITRKDVVSRARQLNLKVNPNAVIHFLPLIGGFVGADTIAVLISLPESNGYRLILDLGTNGEIVVGNKDKMLAASTAAGPALEGAGIRMGMRGTDGAIERVTIEDGKVKFKVIGNKEPVGICGSGLIDAVAEMLRVGIITEKGKLLTREEYLDQCAPENRNLANHLEKIDNINAFVLTSPEQAKEGIKVYLTQKDIRAVQLAKGAIYTGCMLLIKEYGINPEYLDEILIAGAFGNYIDISKGQYIGLLPKFKGVPTRSIGNAAGAGVQRFLLSQEVQKKTLEIQKKITHVELASNPNFRNEYFTNINFSRSI